MSDPPSNSAQGTARRQRAPTITIDTTNDSESPPSNAPPRSPVSPVEDTTSPTTLAASWTSSERTHVPTGPQPITSASNHHEIRASHSFDSKDSRPTSPHNVSSPITSRGNEKGQAFLAVPRNHRSRQNSVDSDDGARSVSSQGETVTATASWQGEKGGLKTPHDNGYITNDDKALSPDNGQEADFEVDNNPFAFSPGQMTKMFNPKSLAAFYKLGGLAGLEKGLRSNRETGLSIDEAKLDGIVSFEEATNRQPSKLATEGVSSPKSPETPVRRRSTTSKRSSIEGFTDRKRVFKDNRLPEKKGKSFLQLVWITYNDKVLILLTVAAIVSLAIGLYQTFGQQHDANEPKIDWVEGVAIIVAIVIVVIVGSLNDWQKERQFAKLNRKKDDRVVKAIRSGKTVEISVHDILAGDVIHLEPGDLLPVDGVLIQGFNVKCDESQATGESDVIRKRPADEVFAAIENGEDPKKLDPFIQSGGRVMEGVGTFMATSTGIYSSYGKTLMSLNEDPEMTPLQSKLNVIAEYIAKLGGAAGLLLFVALFIEFLIHITKGSGAGLTGPQKGQNFISIFIVVVTIIVVAVPEGLPLAVTLALAFATTRMLKDNNLVRHLKACEVMGNATTICSDKTGTLTQNKMKVVSGTVGVSHRFGASEATADLNEGETGMTEKQFATTLSTGAQDLLRKSIALNSTAFEGDAGGDMQFIGSKTETALLLFAREWLGMGPISEERANGQIIQMIPFDSGRKCMGVVAKLDNGGARLYVKGASEILLAKCTKLVSDPTKDLSTSSMTSENTQSIKAAIEHYASRSLRTISIVYRDFERWPPRNAKRAEDDPNQVAFEDIFHRMTFIAMVGIQDPLRDGVPEAVRTCQTAGVVVRMVTGDNILTAKAIATECGILQPDDVVMEGPEFRNLSKFAQNEIIPRLRVLARSSPEDKRILVRRLKDKGEVVAVTGDGTNDAPALKLADVGFSMGITGTEVAKEASSIILMDDNFTSIVKALKWGRAVNDAVKKFLQFQVTVNITAVVITFVSAVSNPAQQNSVFTAVQLLWVNLIMDTLAALALATDPPQDSVIHRKPERRNSSIISITMWKMIIGQSLYQLVVVFVLYYVNLGGLNPNMRMEVDTDSPMSGTPNPTARTTLVFNTFVWMQIFNQWNNRRLDNNFNIFEGLTKNWFFLGINLIVSGLQVLIIFVGGAAFYIFSGRQSGPQWAAAILLGLASVPIGILIRLIPDDFIRKCIPKRFKRKRNLPGVTVSDEERFNQLPEVLGNVRDELAFIKRLKGGRLNNLKFAVKHPRETFMARSRSPSHSRSNSMRIPQTPTREDSVGAASLAHTPDSRRRSRSMRSRSNSALGAPTVMAGLIAGSVATTWSPVEKGHERDAAQSATQPPRPSPSPLSYRHGSGLEEGVLTEEPMEMEEAEASTDVPTLRVPQPPSHKQKAVS
ncbi:putative calcium P-type ATPase [Xylariaceae sp. FL1019]|nr:putative calcium P-type ATPase [Xylariaceae sp. FL1019]